MRVAIPGQLRNPTNWRAHWAERAKWAKQWREDAKLLVRSEARRYHVNQWCPYIEPTDALVITFTVHAARGYDDDNLRAVCKPCRDGVCDALGIEDGPTGGHVWRYGQVIDRAWQGIVVEVV